MTPDCIETAKNRQNATVSQDRRENFGAESSFPKEFVRPLMVTFFFFQLFSHLCFLFHLGMGLRLAVSKGVMDKNDHCAMESACREVAEGL